jgi:hypothetical protein
MKTTHALHLRRSFVAIVIVSLCLAPVNLLPASAAIATDLHVDTPNDS